MHTTNCNKNARKRGYQVNTNFRLTNTTVAIGDLEIGRNQMAFYREVPHFCIDCIIVSLKSGLNELTPVSTAN